MVWKDGGSNPASYPILHSGLAYLGIYMQGSAIADQPDSLFPEITAFSAPTTYLNVQKEIVLVPLVEGDQILLNFIAIIAVNPARFPDINADGAKAFMDWFVGAEAQEIIKNFGVDVYGSPLFFPNAEK